MKKLIKKLKDAFRNLIGKIVTLQNKYTPPNDKLGHFFWGTGYAALGIILAVITGAGIWIVFLPVVAGYLKEVSDYFRDDTFDYKDWLFTSIPGVLFLITYYL